MKNIYSLIEKDFLLELRQRTALSSALLYALSVIFIVYLSFGGGNAHLIPPVWNALFWIIVFFSSITTISKSFVQESEPHLIYYYTLVSAQTYIVAKIIYNTLLLLLINFLSLLSFVLVLGNPIEDLLLFGLTSFIGTIALASLLTLIAAISLKAGNNTTLTAILAFPVLVPLLLMLIKVSRHAIDGLAWSSVLYGDLLVIGALAVLTFGLAYVLFPVVWRS